MQNVIFPLKASAVLRLLCVTILYPDACWNLLTVTQPSSSLVQQPEVSYQNLGPILSLLSAQSPLATCPTQGAFSDLLSYTLRPAHLLSAPLTSLLFPLHLYPLPGMQFPPETVSLAVSKLSGFPRPLTSTPSLLE